MSPFRFRLEKVLAWRRTQLEIEDAKLQRHIGAVAELDRARADLETTAMRSERQVRDWKPLAGQDLAALAGFQVHVRSREKDIATGRRQALELLATQQQAMLEARRRCRLLERLEQRQRAEWQVASDRELEQLATESYLAGRVRRGS
jgi:hypothetical protein